MLDSSPVSSTAGTLLHTAASLKYIRWRDAVSLASFHRSVICGVATLYDIGVLTDQREGGEQLDAVYGL